MNALIKYIVAIILICIFIALGFFIPEWMTDYTDHKIIGKTRFETIELPEIVSVSSDDTLMIESIGLLQDYPQDVNKIALDTGINFDMATVNTKLLDELYYLEGCGIIPKIDQYNSYQINDVSFFVRKDDQSTNAIIWNIIFKGENFWGNFFLDDHTGKIIQFIVTGKDQPFNIGNEVIESWARYLGFQIKNMRKQPEVSYIWVDEKTKVSEGFYSVYHFDLESEGGFLPYTFYTFEDGYGFGYIMEHLTKYYLIEHGMDND